MQLTATEATCPLCKHPTRASEGQPDPTRLCDDCRRIVHTIRSNSSARVAVMDEEPERSIHQPPMSIPVQTEVRLTDEVVAHNTTRGAILVCEPDLSYLDPLAGLDRDPFDIDELFEDVFLGSSPPDEFPCPSSEPAREGVLQDFPAMPEPVREAAPQPESTPSAPVELAAGPPAMAAVIDATPVSPAELNKRDAGCDSQIACTTDGPPVQPLLRHEVVTDPLEPPVQNWTYSQADYPLLVPGAGLGKAARFGLSVAVVLIVCCFVAGYFLLYRPAIQAAQTKQVDAEQPSAPLTEPPAVAQPVATVAASSASGSEATESQGLKTPKDNLDGRYSLQAAAFPNEADANEFTERLKRAGVPSYVLSAEISGRGRWFRVRVGRFESAQEADRFAFEARRRARAAGLNLQLIVTSDDKP